MPIDGPRAENKLNWNERVEGHLTGYRVDRYINDPNHLSDCVTFDKDRLGDLNGLDVLHLQCHIGTDTITLARMGANVTGIDFAPDAIAAAQDICAKSGTPGRFIEAELYDAPAVLDEQFDMVYTGIGALCWLPDIDGWAAVVDHFVKPGGRLFITEAHPITWTIDDERDDDVLQIVRPYFEGRMSTWDADFSYLGDATIANTRTNEWNHGLGEIFTALLKRCFEIKLFEEHRTIPWRVTEAMVEDPEGWFQMPEAIADQIPLMYTLVAQKREG